MRRKQEQTDRLCKCHQEPMRMSNVGWRCVIRVRAAARIRNQRYRQTARGHANYAKHNAHRILIGRDCYARAESIEQAAAINAHIRKRLREQKAQQESDVPLA